MSKSAVDNARASPQQVLARLHELRSYAEDMPYPHLRDMFERDPQRFTRFSRRFGTLLMDFSKQRIDDGALSLLCKLADDAGLREAIDALFAGGVVNLSEQRAAMHWLLRAPRATDGLSEEHVAVQAQLARMDELASRIRAGQWRGFTGEPIRDVVNVGVGGSDLGPLMASRALEDAVPEDAHDVTLHFVSTMDGSQVSHLLHALRPETTLFVVSSKSFGTIDTLSNASTARSWLVRALGDDPAVLRCHFIGVSANAAAMTQWGIPADNQLHMWEWVGGRYSIWSAIGLPVAIRVGMSGFREFLAGAHALDEHFCTAPWQDNLPVLLALLGIWNSNCLDIAAHAILPYDGRLKYLPGYLSQLEMESNGKAVRQDGEPVQVDTCPVVWGDVGPNAQHAFYQLLHQGTQPVCSDFIVPARRYEDGRHAHASSELIEQHQLALANCLAQSRLLALGEGAVPEAEQLPGYKRYHGNQPSTTLLLDALTPYSLGVLIALYEHKVFTQATIWGINPFDQWGVEMGKRIANDTLARLQGRAEQPLDSSSDGLVSAIRARWRNGER